MEPVRAKRSVGSRTIHVVDGAIPASHLELLSRFLHDLPYFRQNYDHEGVRQFLHFKRGLPTEEIDGNPLLRTVRSAVLAEYARAYPDLPEPQLDRVYVNLIPHGDHSSTHVDDERGVTAIVYANAEWNDDWHGETLYYDGDEAVAATAPRPGRIVLLPADVPHRVGAVSRLFGGARITIAFKFKTSEKVA